MTSKAISSIPRKLALSNESYDFWNKFITVVLPGFTALYIAIDSIWGVLPYPDKVALTVAAVGVFGKLLLNFSKKSYEDSGAATVQAIEKIGTDGTLTVDTVNAEKDVVSLNLDGHPLSLVNKDVVLLKVDNAAQRAVENGMDPRLISDN